MKKILVLVFVLGLSSLANATVLTWSTDYYGFVLPGETFTVQIIASDNLFYDPTWVGNDPSPIAEVEIANITEINNNAGDASSLIDPAGTGFPGWWTIGAADLTAPFDSVKSGAQWNVQIRSVYGCEFIEFHSNNNILTFVPIVPEPATIALLCIGGLLLRRRK